MGPSQCPTPEQLSAFSLGDLSESALAAVADHLETCPSCQEQVRALDSVSDPVLDALRHPPASGDIAGSDAPTHPGGRRAAVPQGYAMPPRLGDYRLVREIGRGGMGVVFEATQESLGRRVALKVLPAGPTLDPHLEMRFEREARAAARLHHTNIVPVFGVGRVAGVRYYAMQFIEGQGLDRALDELRALRRAGATRATLSARAASVPKTVLVRDAGLVQPPAGAAAPAGTASGTRTEAGDPPSARSRSSRGHGRYYATVARLGKQVAEALAYAHAQGILHRDIKPSNLLLDLQGTVWVTDFGLAKTAGEPDNLTQSGDLVGTLRYLAPERVRGECDGRSDVYSLGLTLYELVTLQPAFEATERSKLLQQVLDGAIPRPRKLASDLPRDLETIILKATVREPARRYAGAAELADDLGRFLDHRPIRARRTGPLGRTWRWARRHPVVAVLLVSLLVTLAGGLAGITWNYRKAEAARAREQLQREAAEHSLYNSRIAQARLQWQANNLAGAQKLLDDCVPAEGATDRRNWEWHYLRRLCRTGLEPRMGHDAWAWGVAFSPDGRHLASAGGGDPYFGNPGHQVQPGEVIVWDAANGRRLRTLKRGHTHLVEEVAYSPDGRHLASAGADHLTLWDARSGQPRWHSRPAGSPRCVAFAPDGSAVVLGCWEDAVCVLDVSAGKVLHRFATHRQAISAVSFAPDGKTLAACGTEETQGGPSTIHLWDWVTKTERAERRITRPGVVRALAFSPDSRHLAVGGTRGLELYDAATSRLVQALAIPPGGVNAVAFSPDGRYLATGGGDTTVRVWNISDGTEVLVLRGHTDPVRAVAFSPDGEQLASGGRDGSVKLWDVTRNPECTLLRHETKDWVQALGWLPDGRQLAVVNHMPGQLLRIQAATGEVVSRRALDATERWDSPCAKAVLDGAVRRVATVSALDPRVVTVTDAASGRELCRLRGHRAPLRGLAFSRDGRRVASGGSTGPPEARRGEVKVWELTPEGGAPARPLLERELTGLTVLGLAFSPDGSRLALAARRSRKAEGADSLGSVVRVVDLARGEDLYAAEFDDDVFCAVAFSPDGRRLAAVGFDHGTLLLRDLADDGREVRVRTEVGAASDLAFSPDGARLAVAGRRLIRLLDARTAEELLTLQPPFPVPGDPGSSPRVCFSPDGKRLAALLANQGLCLWDVEPGPLAPSAERLFAWHLRNAAQQTGFGQAFHLRRLEDSEPPRLGLRVARARLYADRGDHDKAEADLVKALAAEPDSGQLWFERGRVALLRQRWSQAATCYGRGLELQPQDLEAWQLRAAALVLADDLPGYRQLCERLQFHMAEAEDTEVALVLARVRALVPGHPTDGATQVRLAVKALEERKGGNEGMFRTYAGWGYYRAGQAAEACRELDIAGTKPPGWVALYRTPLLALARARAGQQEQARQWLEKARAQSSRPADTSLVSWLEFLVLRREAERMLGEARR